MKFKIVTLIFIITTSVLTISSAFSQDTSQTQKLTREHTYPIRSNKYETAKHHIYRDTRLGGSSPYFNTYKKNDYGAGAITTDPHKANGIAKYPNDYFDSGHHSNKIYGRHQAWREVPELYNNYKTNDYGAGAITTNPHKGNNSGVSIPYVTYPAPDSTG